MRRGEIWWARLAAPRRSRPVLLVSRDEAYRLRPVVTVVPLTSTIRGLPVEVVVGPAEGVRQRSAINVDDLITIPTSSLDRLVTSLSEAKMREVSDAIKFALALD